MYRHFTTRMGRRGIRRPSPLRQGSVGEAEEGRERRRGGRQGCQVCEEMVHSLEEGEGRGCYFQGELSILTPNASGTCQSTQVQPHHWDATYTRSRTNGSRPTGSRVSPALISRKGGGRLDGTNWRGGLTVLNSQFQFPTSPFWRYIAQFHAVHSSYSWSQR